MYWETFVSYLEGWGADPPGILRNQSLGRRG